MLYWVSVHVLAWILFVSHETRLSRSYAAGSAHELVAYAIVSIGTIFAYRAICWSDPGWITAEMAEDLVDVDMKGEYAQVAAEECPLADNSMANPHDDPEAQGTIGDSEAPEDEDWDGVLATARIQLRASANTLDRADEEDRRWCKLCKLWQPIRAKHCFECRKCCPKFDHHCFWIGTCVGERNHGIFWLYLAVQSVEASWALSIAWSAWRHTSKHRMSLGSQIKDWLHLNVFVLPINTLLIVFVLFPVGLLAYHTYLAVSAQTTWEAFRMTKITYLEGLPEDSNPFNRGLRTNLRLFFFPPRDRLIKWNVSREEDPTAWAHNSLVKSRTKAFHDCRNVPWPWLENPNARYSYHNRHAQRQLEL